MSSGAAPYYQLRGQAYPNGHSYGAPDEDYSLSGAMAPQAPMYGEAGQSHNPLVDAYSTQAQHDITDSNGGAHMAQLLQAANSVVEQDQVAQGNGTGSSAARRSTRNMGLGQAGADGSFASPTQGGRGKRKRPSSPMEQGEKDTADKGDQDADGMPTPRRSKRARPFSLEDLHDPALDAVLAGARTEAVPSAASKTKSKATPKATPNHGDKSSPERTSPASAFPHMYPNALTDARAAGVHSAAALFRRPSNNPVKKYTRPPMSKLFMSLQLSPENFLHLQAAAKTYMLDPAHPERQNCVGSRGKGDTDMVKLRLFNCVNEFLQAGVGERFFGADVPAPTALEAGEAAAALGEAEPPPVRQWIWPRDATKIITLVTPLLRRMVTNERQRQYAIETRKGGASAKKKDGPGRGHEHGEEGEVDAPYDPTLSEEHRHHLQHGSPYAQQLAHQQHQHQPPPPPVHLENNLTIVLLKHGRKLCPSVDIPNLPDAGPFHSISFSEVQMIVQDMLASSALASDDARKDSAAAVAEQVDGEEEEETAVPAGVDADDGDMARIRAAAERALSVAKDNAKAAAAAAEAKGETEQVEEEQTAEEQDGDAQQQRQQQEEVQEQEQAADEPASKQSLVYRVLTAAGMVVVREEEEWEGVKMEVGREVGLEGCLRIVVEVV